MTSTRRSPSPRRCRPPSVVSRCGRSWSSTDGPVSAVAAAVADAHRREWARVLAATVRVTRDLDLAEECVQDAYARALDELRRSGTMRAKLPLLVEPAEPAEPSAFPDDRLRLVFTCCHPALALEARVALTLRLVCGLSTPEVARAFLVPEATMAARLTRAKKKITQARIPYRVPAPEELSERVSSVLTVVHLLFSTGHTAAAGSSLQRPDLVERALDLARMLRLLLPSDPDVAGLLALVLLTDARRETRVGADGRLLLLEEQDRNRWDRSAIAEGVTLVREALRSRPPGRFALQAAIAAVHSEAPSWRDTDWREVVALYDLLRDRWPSPVVALNRAVAVGLAEGPTVGLAELRPLPDEPQLARYPSVAAARADFLRRLARVEEARSAYEEALLLTDNEVERRFLGDRLNALPPCTTR